MKIAVIGLGKMGMQITQKLVKAEHQVIVHNRSQAPIEQAVTYGAIGAFQKADVLKAFGSQPPIIWFMLPAAVVDAELEEWLSLLPTGSCFIDGGNSDFRVTKQRVVRVRLAGMQLLDCGTSGGVWGLKNGFSLMIGGDRSTFSQVEPLFQALAQPQGAYRYFGESGAGHYVKMVHNAIEYGMMESLAEGYQLLRVGPYQDIDLAAVGQVWQQGSVISSWLNELSRQALAGNPTLDGVDGYVAETGEARWALEIAKAKGLGLPAIQAAMQVRLASQAGKTSFATKLISAMRHAFGGHLLNKP